MAVRGGVEGGAVEQLCRETMTNAVNDEASPKIRGKNKPELGQMLLYGGKKPSMIPVIYKRETSSSGVLEGESGGKSFSVAI